jgi:hypothetical protein
VSADPQLIFVDKIGFLEIFFSFYTLIWPLGNFFLFLDLYLDSWTVGPSELLEK